jgi:hypothetical protein
MSEPSNAQREAVISLMAEVWDDFVSDTGCFPDDFTILPRRRLQFVAGRWAGMIADALYGPNGPLATALAEAEARGRQQGLEWHPIETAPTDYTEVIGMDASGVVARTWFFAPSSQTRKWLKVGLPGKKDWRPVLWTHLPPTAPTETQKPKENA